LNFWPHDAIGWLAVIVPSLGALGWILNIYVKEPLDRLTTQFEKMKDDTDERLENHERRIMFLEKEGRGL